MADFWQGLPRPFLALAPMEDVTDTVFRQIVAGVGRPNVFFTEFVNVEGMDSSGRGEVTKRLRYTEAERPIAAQIWGVEPGKFYEAAKVIKSLRFDGIDINFGCPVKDVVKKGACAAMIDPVYRKQVEEIIAATKEGAAGLPVSVKTRIGVKKIVTEDWIGWLLEQGLAAITVHGRTVAEESRVPAHWEEIGKAVKLRDLRQPSGVLGAAATSSTGVLPRRQEPARGASLRASSGSPLRRDDRTLIIGNGDVGSYQEAMEKVRQYGVDGVMIGRGIFKNPWIFDKSQAANPKSQKDRLALLIKHAKLWEETWGESRNFAVVKKFVKMYVNGFDGAADLRAKLMLAGRARELISLAAVSTRLILSHTKSSHWPSRLTT